MPTWVTALLLLGVLPYFIIAPFLTKRMRIDAPLCQRHRKHWYWRSVVFWSVFMAVVFLVVAGILLAVTAAALKDRGWDQKETTVLASIGGIVCSGGCLLSPMLLVIPYILLGTGIRATAITDRSITLVGVHDAFVDAVELQRDLERQGLEIVDEDAEGDYG